MTLVRRSFLSRYGLAIGVVLLVTLVEVVLWDVFDRVPYMLFYGAVMVAAWFGGVGPGLLSIGLAAFLTDYYLMAPFGLLAIFDPGNAIRHAAFIFVCLLMVFLTERLQAIARSLSDSDEALRAERVQLEATLAELEEERRGLTEANEQLHVQAEEMEVQAEQLQARSDELQEAEQRLRGQLAYTAAVTSSLEEGLCAVDAAGRFTFANPAAERLLGWGPGQLLGKPLHDVVHRGRGCERQGRCVLLGLGSSDRVRVQEDVFTRADGGPLAVSFTCSPLLGGQQSGGAVIAFSDVTDRRRGEEERARLLESERRARAEAEAARERTVDVLESMDDAYVALDRELRYVALNRRASEMLRYSPQQLLGRRVLDVFPDLRGRPEYECLVEAMRTGTPTRFEMRYEPYDAWFETRVFPNPGGASTFTTDITQRKEGEIGLRQSEERLRLALEAGSMGTWDWNRVTGELVWSERLQELFGLEPGSFDGRFETYVSMLHPEDRDAVVRAIEHAALHGGEYVVLQRVLLAAGQVRWIEGRGTAFRDAEGRTLRMTGVSYDVTEREESAETIRRLNERLESRVRERTAELEERSAEMEAFSYSISHDLRAPLRAMRGFADAILEHPAAREGGGVHQYARRIAAAAEHMDTLIQDLLAYSRLSQGRIDLEPLSLAVVVRDAIAQLPAEQTGRDGRIQVEVDEALPRIAGHRAILHQIITNLVSNGLKFVPPGSAPKVRLCAEDRGEFVRLWVEDNGIGIAPRYHERIFRVFERLHRADLYPGTGVGLAIVRRGARRMGGDAGVLSDLGQGSRFWIDLRRSRRRAGPEKPTD